jgi:hypothetical protein
MFEPNEMAHGASREPQFGTCAFLTTFGAKCPHEVIVTEWTKSLEQNAAFKLVVVLLSRFKGGKHIGSYNG